MKKYIATVASIYFILTITFVACISIFNTGYRSIDLAAFFGPIGWLVFPGSKGLNNYAVSTAVLLGLFVVAYKARLKSKVLGGTVYASTVVFWLYSTFAVAITSV